MAFVIDAYLRRIGLATPPAADLAGLALLARAHIVSVPFENLDIGAHRPLSLEVAALEAKLVGAGRGGFCYELNGLFAVLLEALGFRVTRLAAETWDAGSAGWGPPLDHLVLRVDLDDPVIVDVGFGDTFRSPLPLRPGAVGPDELGRTFELRPDGDRLALFEQTDPSRDPIPQYRFGLEPYALDDFRAMCRYQETQSPHFTGHRMVSVATADGRRTIWDDRFIVHAAGTRTERRVTDVELPGLLREQFGIAWPPDGQGRGAESWEAKVSFAK